MEVSAAAGVLAGGVGLLLASKAAGERKEGIPDAAHSCKCSIVKWQPLILMNLLSVWPAL